MLEEKVLNTIKINSQIKSGDSIVLGVSGGPDSICMLNILYKLSKILNFNIVVAHINHMIRQEAICDEEYVENFCNKLNIPIYIKREDVIKIAKEGKIGTEEAGRNIRYNFFEEILRKTNSNKIATAHNLNDNAETMLMNIFRGTGLTGLKGIEKNREDKYIRPLIDCMRNEIEEYCNKNNLNPKIDKTNMENIYTRNKIRNICIPYIEKEFNSNIIKTLGRLSEIVCEETEYINSIIKVEYGKILVERTKKEIVLDLKQLNKLEMAIKKRLILYTISELIGNTCGIEKVNIEDIVKLCERNIGNKYLKPTKNIKILVKNKKVFFSV